MLHIAIGDLPEESAVALLLYRRQMEIGSFGVLRSVGILAMAIGAIPKKKFAPASGSLGLVRERVGFGCFLGWSLPGGIGLVLTLLSENQ